MDRSTCTCFECIYMYCNPHLEEGRVHEAGVIVDELKEEHLEGVTVLVVGLGPRVLPVRDLAGDDLER